MARTDDSLVDDGTLFDPPAWREVPQALFLSWSEARQLDWCARRDEDAALREEREHHRQFYKERAEAYRCAMKLEP